jgi:hypothetical protein
MRAYSRDMNTLPLTSILSIAIPTLVFHAVVTRTTGASQDQVQTVGGLDPASQLLAPAAYRYIEFYSTVHNKVYHMQAMPRLHPYHVTLYQPVRIGRA